MGLGVCKHPQKEVLPSLGKFVLPSLGIFVLNVRGPPASHSSPADSVDRIIVDVPGQLALIEDLSTE